jgi:aminodeoxyfutalosine synthase
VNTTTELPSFLKNSALPAELTDIAIKVEAGERITAAEGLLLFEKGEIGFLGMLANLIRERKNGSFTYFNRNFHIEPTNVCVFTCKFCSYSRVYKNREEGWELSKNDMLDRVRAYRDIPVTEVHIVGGVHPKLDLDFFCDVLSEIKAIRPDIHIKAFTAVELDYMIRKAKLTYEEGLKKLIASGLDSIPGGGAEIFDETVREEICADKCSSEQWLTIHEAVHRLGLHSNATMLYGHIESYHHRIDHLSRLRELQDRTNGFNTFIPLKFRNKDNDMSHISEVTMVEDLKNYAVSRIFLDNFPHIKAYWPMIGRSTAQVALAFGVDDIDGTIDDSTKIYTMAGAEEQSPALTTQQLVQLIKDVNRIPVERDTLYNVMKNYSEAQSEPA